MNVAIRTLGGLLVVLAAACAGMAAEAEGKKAADAGKEAAPAEKYEGAEAAVPHAGSCCEPRLVPVCRCEPTKKKKPKTEYEVKCELVCVPGCGSHVCGKRHGCTSCCDTSPCRHATIRTKKTLVKKVVDKEEDALEYKVEWVRPDCDSGCCSTEACGTPQGSRAFHVRAWQAVHGFWHRVFHWK